MAPTGMRLGLLSLPLLVACISHTDAGPTPGTEGSATLTVTRPSGIETLGIAGPPGELRLRFEERQNDCILWLSADDPRTGDLTSAAKARRIALDVRVSTKEAPGLLTATAVTAKAHAGLVFTSESTVVLRRNRSATVDHAWWSPGGGTVTLSPVGAVGTEVTIDLVDVALAPEDDEGAATVSGHVTAKVQKLFVNGAGGCPVDVPGR